MRKFELNARQILYLASLSGATEFIGIPDGFYGMDELEIKQEIMDIQSELEQKGYAEADFDGDFTPHADIMQDIKLCSACAKFISVEKAGQGEPSSEVLFYIQKNQVIKIEGNMGNYILTHIELSEIQPDILTHINWSTPGAVGSSEESTVISTDVLLKIKQKNSGEFSEESAKAELKKMGCSDRQVQIICDGLTAKAAYYSVIMIDFTHEESKMDSIMIINAEAGALEMIPGDGSRENVVNFMNIDYETFKNRLNHSLGRLRVWEGDGDLV